MGHKIIILLQICWTMTPILAAFKDFVIESEQDLQRFGMTSEETYYEDDDDVDVDNLKFYSELPNAYEHFIDDSCGGYGSDDAAMMTDSHMQFNYEIDVQGNDGSIDSRFLNALLHKLASDPRFRYSSDDHPMLDCENSFKEVVSGSSPASYGKFYEYDDPESYDEDF